MSESSTLTAPPATPSTLTGAMDPVWLTHALKPVTGGARITDVEVVEVIRTMATKVRFRAKWSGGEAALCLKAFLDVEPELAKGGGATTIAEADFYAQIAPQLDIRVPACVATVTDRENEQGIIIMRDLIVDGARFCTALEPFSVDQAAASLEQIANLHAGAPLLERVAWVRPRLREFAARDFVPAPALQEMLDGPRGDGLDANTRDAARLIAGLKALALVEAAQPQTLVHGDCHAGNIFRNAEGRPGLIDWQLVQSGWWALDVAYHLCAILPVETAEAHEWDLLDHYLEHARRRGVDVPSGDAARDAYRICVLYGYYLWAITRRVDPPIINVFVDRLGKATARHDSFRRLAV
jgi:hypothetical protein